jgi:hypothetical protein
MFVRCTHRFRKTCFCALRAQSSQKNTLNMFARCAHRFCENTFCFGALRALVHQINSLNTKLCALRAQVLQNIVVLLGAMRAQVRQNTF